MQFLARTQKTCLKFLTFPALNVNACLPKQDLNWLGIIPRTQLLYFGLCTRVGRWQAKGDQQSDQFKQGDVSFPYPRVNLPTTRAPRRTSSLSAKRTIRRAMTSENTGGPPKKSMNGVIRTRKKERAVPSPLIFINIVMIDKISGEIKWTLSFQYIQLKRLYIYPEVRLRPYSWQE